MSDIGLAGIPTSALKRDPTTGEVNPAHVDGSQSIEFGRQFVKNKSTSNATQTLKERLADSQTMRSEGEKLAYPMETGNPAYQARVSFRMFSLQPKSDSAAKKSHLAETPVDNTKKNANSTAGLDETWQSGVGPTTTGSGANQLQFSADENYALKGAGVKRDDNKITSIIGNAVKGTAGSIYEKGKQKFDELVEVKTIKKNLSTFMGGFKFLPVKHAPVVDMYFPLSFTYVDTAQYENASLGITGTVGAAAAEAGAGVLGSVLASMKEGATSTFDAFMGNKQMSEGVARVAAARAIDVSGALFNQGFRNALTLQNRTVVNPNIRALFRGVALREFTFQFKMIAESAQEAASIQKIVKHFRTEMYPDVYNLPIGSTGVAADLGFKFPNVFQITFNYKNSENLKLPRLQLCYLRNVSHTVNPTGGGFRRDGQPNEIDLTLSFVEYKTLNRQDVENNGKEGGF